MKLNQSPIDQPRRADAQRGFTLAEMMVVIVIIGLLATLVVPNVLGYFQRAAGTKAKADIQQIVSAIESFDLHYHRAPESLQELVTPPNGEPAILNRVPVDPWTREYLYESAPPGSKSRPRVYTLGKDGSPGGEGEDRDLDSHELFGGGEN